MLLNGEVIDGTGKKRFRGDVALQGERIAQIGKLEGAPARRVIDCEGLAIAPGFVDFHGHSDLSILEFPTAQSHLVQGCTLTLAGNRGGSAAPVGAIGLDTFFDGLVHPRWRSFAEHLEAVEEAQSAINYASLVGHNTLLRAFVGWEDRGASAGESGAMKPLLARSIEEGAFGLSTGLVFQPGCFSATEEIVELAKVVAQYDALYASHIRGERITGMEATREFLEIGERSGARLHMSHMQSKYPVLGQAFDKMALFEAARAKGLQVSCDSDVFKYFGSPLGVMPPLPFPGSEFIAQIKDKAGRARLKAWLKEVGPYHPLGRDGNKGLYQTRSYDHTEIVSCRSDPRLVGKSIAQVAVMRGGIEWEDALFDLAIEDDLDGRSPIFIWDYIEDEHYKTMPYPYAIFPSTDLPVMDPEKFEVIALGLNPEVWLGLFPRVLGQFVREEKLVSLEEAIRKMTGFATGLLGIADRGLVKEGLYADMVVFNPDTVANRGTFANPKQYPAGIEYVLVNGQLTVVRNRYTGARAGKVLRSKFRQKGV